MFLFQMVVATCPNEWQEAGYNCFVASLGLRVFGDVDDSTTSSILTTVQGLLNSTDMQAAMSSESGFVTSDADLSGGNRDRSNSSSGSSLPGGGLSAGRKAMISLLAIAGVALFGAFAYRRYARSKEIEASSNGQESDNRESTYGV